MNRRKGRRKRVRVPAGMEPGRITSYTGDLSQGGVFVYSTRVHRPGTRVRVVLRTPDGPIPAVGVVRWAKRVPAHFLQHVRGGMGVEFTELTPELQIYLEHTLSGEGVLTPEAASSG